MKIKCLALRIRNFAGLALAFCLGSAQAAFVLLDNFETTTTGAINGQNGWTGDSSFQSFDLAGNQVMRSGVRTGTIAERAYKTLPSTIGDSGPTSTGTLFFRTQLDSIANTSADTIFGLATEAVPGVSTSDYETYGIIKDVIDASTSGSLLIRNGGSSTDVLTLNANTWYSIWMVADNLNNTVDVYAKVDDGTAATVADQIANNFSFRDMDAAALATFVLRNDGTNQQKAVYLDDIFVDNGGLNLAYAVPEPSAALLGAFAALALLCRRRA